MEHMTTDKGGSMKYLIVIAVAAALAVAGCGSSKSIATNPEAKHQLAVAEGVAKTCITKSVPPKPRAILTCIAPPGHKAALESCAVSAITHGFYSQRKLIKGLAVCVERYR